MKSKKLIIYINRLPQDIFSFALNPQNTPKWIDSIMTEQTNEWPIKKGTIYKNQDTNGAWSEYKITEFKKNEMVVFSKIDKNYHARYIFTPTKSDQTKLEYNEWVDHGELDEPLTQKPLERLKEILEERVKILTLPVSRWRDYKKLRLQAFSEDPQAFGLSYKNALQKPDDEWIKRIEDAEKGKTDILYFAEHEGNLIGMLGAYFNKSPQTQKNSRVWGMYIKKEYRNQGIGKLLLERILEKLKKIADIEKATLHVNIDQKTAVSLYKEMGFTIVGTENMVLGDGKKHEMHEMELALKN